MPTVSVDTYYFDEDRHQQYDYEHGYRCFGAAYDYTDSYDGAGHAHGDVQAPTHDDSAGQVVERVVMIMVMILVVRMVMVIVRM